MARGGIVLAAAVEACRQGGGLHRVLLFGGLLRWGYHSYGYGPSGLAGALGLILVALLITGRL